MIEYREGNRLDAAAVAALYRNSGLRRPVDDLPRIARMLEHANVVISAWEGGRLVGLARSFTDFAWVTYLADLAVAAEYQRRGIGRELIRRTLERTPGTDCVLRSSVIAADYYPHLGFRKVENGWFWPGRELGVSRP